MKLRTLDHLLSALNSESSWRKKELSSLYLLISKNNKNHKSKPLIRASVPICYAHWEGFTKISGEIYLEYVSRQKELHKNLTENFIAISCNKKIKEIVKSNKISPQIDMINFILNSHEKRSILPYKNVIDTKSNLNSDVLRNIFHVLGFEYDEYWRKKELAIDGILLKHRNAIVHGEKSDIDFYTYQEIHSLSIENIEQIKTTVENAACLKAFLLNK